MTGSKNYRKPLLQRYVVRILLMWVLKRIWLILGDLRMIGSLSTLSRHGSVSFQSKPHFGLIPFATYTR